jgi:transcriptional regulator with XRE-family HTH domain
VTISLRKIREEKGLTPKRMAELTGYSEKTISAYELGRQEPSVAFLEKASEVLNVSIDDLRKENLPMEESPPFWTGGIAVAILDKNELLFLRESFHARKRDLLGLEYRKLDQAVDEITHEMEKRGITTADLIMYRKGKMPDPSSVLSDEEKASAASFLKGVGPSESGGSSPESGAGAPPPVKPVPPLPSSQVTKPPRSGHGGKEKT